MSLLRVMKFVLFALLSLLLLAGCGSVQKNAQSQGLTSFEDVANYIKAHNKLPDNFITKDEAKKLGWDPQKGNLHKVAPGKSIGGDVFQNREGKLPKKKGRVWYEADINYKSDRRGKDRILFSNDGLIYKTEDHYETFEQIK
ncbi:ribonuclease domain-containing protein [Paenibacillus sp. MZ04-78.2]|uniref:ribonuclease domain-containing protein n=1 Tax=Paenibacillus sp. MZ04-78.2 TaxID=2962034 RepID=UPI0035CC32E7